MAHGLAKVLSPETLTIIVNTGDDFWHYGLRICPDLDTIMYTLSGLVDKTNGWGIAEDSTVMLESLKRLGETPWFRLGDKDTATHLLRTMWLREGQTLTEVTSKLANTLGVQARILPMTDSEVATKLETVEHGEMEFQEYFVKMRWQPAVKSLRFEGIEKAVLTPEVVETIYHADAIIIGPSNPWLSIAPILNLPQMREQLRERDVPRVAVTPIVEGAAVKGPAAKLMAELGYDVSAKTVAAYYDGVINGFVYDVRDVGLTFTHLNTIMLDTIMKTEQDREVLAKNILNWIGAWN